MNIKKALRSRHAFFYAFILLYSISNSSHSNSSTKSNDLLTCKLATSQLHQLESVKARTLKDGDSFILTDGREIRLVGINTPEMYKKPHGIREPYALEAKSALKALLAQGFFLQVAQQTHDRYGRTLAYAYDKNGRNIEAQLIQKGLGFAIAYPPNIQNLSCLLASQSRARLEKRGVWKDEYYTPVSSKQLESHHAGFIRLTGKLMNITYTKKSWWLQLDGNAVLQIRKDEQRYFNKKHLDALKRRKITVNGWLVDRSLSRSKNQHSPFMLYLKHPSHIESP